MSILILLLLAVLVECVADLIKSKCGRVRVKQFKSKLV